MAGHRPSLVTLRGRLEQQQQQGRGRKRESLLRVRSIIGPLVTTRICQMYRTMRAYFAATIVLPFAFDASRLRGRIRRLGYIERPDGYGGWLLPRAAGLTYTCCVGFTAHKLFRAAEAT